MFVCVCISVVIFFAFCFLRLWLIEGAMHDYMYSNGCLCMPLSVCDWLACKILMHPSLKITPHLTYLKLAYIFGCFLFSCVEPHPSIKLASFSFHLPSSLSCMYVRASINDKAWDKSSPQPEQFYPLVRMPMVGSALKNRQYCVLYFATILSGSSELGYHCTLVHLCTVQVP